MKWLELVDLHGETMLCPVEGMLVWNDEENNRTKIMIPGGILASAIAIDHSFNDVCLRIMRVYAVTSPILYLDDHPHERRQQGGEHD